MAEKNTPRSGSMAYYPRVRSRVNRPMIRSAKSEAKEAKVLTFMGYKAGMTHIMGKDSYKNSPSHKQEIFVPVTVIEVPKMKVMGYRAYIKNDEKSQIAALTDVLSKKFDKHVVKKVKNLETTGKKKKTVKKAEKDASKIVKENKDKIVDVRLLTYTQPSQAGSSKKTPDIVELLLSGTVDQKLEFAASKLDQEVGINDVFQENEFVDVKGITKGKGMAGPVKRFGVKVQRPKAKKRRIVGCISPWHPATVAYTTPRAGEMGYHSRTEFNKKIMRIDSDPEKINPKGDFLKYGQIKGDYVLVSGSVPGAAKRAVAFRHAIRPHNEHKYEIEEISYVSQASKQWWWIKWKQKLFQ